MWDSQQKEKKWRKERLFVIGLRTIPNPSPSPHPTPPLIQSERGTICSISRRHPCPLVYRGRQTGTRLWDWVAMATKKGNNHWWSADNIHTHIKQNSTLPSQEWRLLGFQMLHWYWCWSWPMSREREYFAAWPAAGHVPLEQLFSAPSRTCCRSADVPHQG